MIKSKWHWLAKDNYTAKFQAFNFKLSIMKAIIDKYLKIKTTNAKT